MQTITPAALFQLLKNGSDIQLVDVREPYEHAAFNIGGDLIPLGDIMQQADKINQAKPVIFYCRKGIRSHLAIQRLQQKFPFYNLVNLIGGIDDWEKQVGPV